MFRVEADFEHLGLRCVVVMTDLGHRCGYVGLKETSPLYGKDYYNSLVSGVQVHGGLTYASTISTYPVSSDLWWFGYDCGHSNDRKEINEVTPELRAVYERLGYFKTGILRTLDYCIDQCKSLAEQLMLATG